MPTRALRPSEASSSAGGDLEGCKSRCLSPDFAAYCANLQTLSTVGSVIFRQRYADWVCKSLMRIFRWR